MRKMTVRVTSLLMALCMLVGILPTTPYVAKASEAVPELTSQVLNFVSDTYSMGFEGRGEQPDRPLGDWSVFNTTPATLAVNGWQYNAEKSTMTTSGYGIVQHPNTGIVKNGHLAINCNNAGDSLAIDVDVKKTGWYKIEFLTKTLSAADISNGRNLAIDVEIDGTKVGAIDFGADGKLKDDPTKNLLAVADKVYLEEGIRTFRVIRNNGSGHGKWAYVYNITFREVYGPAADFSVDFEAATSSLEDATYSVDGFAVNEEYSIFRRASLDNGLKMTADDKGDQVSIDFYHKNEGNYDISLVLERNADYASSSRVYIDGKYLADVDFSDTTGEAEIALGALNLSGGVHTFTVRSLDDGEATLKVKKVNFAKRDADITTVIPDTVKVKMPSTSLIVGDMVDIIVSAANTDGSLIANIPVKASGDPETENYITIASSNTNVVSIANGEVIANSVGAAYIVATAYINKSELKTKVPVTVSGASSSDAFKLVIDDVLPEHSNRLKEVSIHGIDGDVVVDLSKATDWNVESTDEDVATAEIMHKSNGTVLRVYTWGKQGPADITVSAKYNGELAEAVLNFVVDDTAPSTKPFKIEFGNSRVSDFSSLDINVDNWRVSEETLNDPVYKVKRNILKVHQFGSASAAFHLDWSRGNSYSYNENGEQKSVECESFSDGEKVVLEIRVPATGWYRIDLTGQEYGNNGTYASFHIDDQFAGEFDFADLTIAQDDYKATDTNAEFVEKRLRDLYLTEGIHKFTVKRCREAYAIATRNAFAYLQTLKLTPIPAPKEIIGLEVKTTATKLQMGDSADASFKLRLSDGSNYHFAQCVPNTGSLDITEVTPDRLDYANGTITALSYGTGVIKVTGKRPGYEDYSGNWSVPIVRGQMYNFAAAPEGKADAVSYAEENWTLDTSTASTTSATKTSAKVSAEDGLEARLRSNGHKMGLKINVLKAGAYDVDISVNKKQSAATTDIYLNSTFLGTVDFATGVESEEKDVVYKLNSVQLNAGENTLHFVRRNATGGNMMYVNRLVINMAESMPTFSNIAITADSDEIKIGETTQANVKVWMSNGREYLFGKLYDGSADPNNSIAISSTDSTKITVDETGLLKGIAQGSANLKVDLKLGGTDYSEEKTFNCIRTVKVNYANHLFPVRLESDSTEITATLDGADIDLSTATITATPGDNKITASIREDQGKFYLDVEASRAGDTYVTVSVTSEGATGTVDVPVTVVVPGPMKETPTINFISGYSGSPDSLSIASHGWAVNNELTTEGIIGSSNYGLNANGISAFVQKVGGRLVMDFMANYSGYYAIDIIGVKYGNYGGIFAMYMDDEYVGTYDFKHPTDDPSINEKLVKEDGNTVYISQGLHTFTFERLEDGNNNYRHNTMYLTELTFTKVDGNVTFEKAEAKLDRAENRMVVGETAKITTGALMSDGSFRNFGLTYAGEVDTQNIAPVVTNETPSVIKIENGVVTALTEGTGKVKVVATVDGVEKTNVLEIEVVGEEIGSVEATLTDSTIYVNKVVGIDVVAKTVSGTVIKADDVTFTASSSDDAVATTDGLSVKGISAGDAVITVSATFGGNTVSKEIPVTVKADGVTELYVKAYPRLIRPTNVDGTPNTVGTQIKVESATFNGEPVDLTDATIVFSTTATDIIDLNTSTGKVLPKGPTGEALVNVSVTIGNETLNGEINIVVTKGKVGSSYYTEDKVKNARENINRYKWARDEMEATLAQAEKYLGIDEVLWDRVTTQEVPRSTTVGYYTDPKKQFCRDPRCNANHQAIYSNTIYAFNMDPVNRPFQLQCKACRKWFPSNDFDSFYKLGLDEHKIWSYQKSLEANQALVDAGEDGYLVNIRHPEMNGYTYQDASGATIVESDNWGVDDGYGYRTGRNSTDGTTPEVFSWIAMYNRFLLDESHLYGEAVKHLSRAYMFTGDKEYARPVAIALDRLADLYPTFDTTPYHLYSLSGEKGNGRIEGRIWEPGKVSRWTHAYDLVWDIYDDPYVINFLKEKAEQYKLDNDKSTPEKIRENFETNVLREAYEALQQGDIYGNFGLHQILNVDAAIVLDDYENGTKDMLDYMMRYDEHYLNPGSNVHTGGEVLHKLYNDVDRDGGTLEGIAPNYTNLWYNTIVPIADGLNGYTGYPGMDLFKLPRLSKMLKNQMNYMMTRKQSLPVGDSGVMAGTDRMLSGVSTYLKCYRATGDEEFLQIAYFANGNKVTNINEGIYAKDPEEIQNIITKVINEKGEINLDDSRLLAGTGFAILRDGSWYGRGTATENDNQRDFWMTGGLTGIHGHWDGLSIGAHAFGIPVLPDLGYPDQLPDHKRRYWGLGTISHNTVVVDADKHVPQSRPMTPLHFDDAGRVKVMDMENPDVKAVTEEYRRTLVMIDANDDVSYAVDFFRVKGGSEHVYSFHAQSQEIYDYDGFHPFPKDGTYAGENVAYGNQSKTNGYSYLDEIRTDDNPRTGTIMTDFKITDYHKIGTDSENVHVKINMLNDFDLTDVTFAHGDVPDKPNNPEYVEFLLARRMGENLDSTFTSVIQPYRGEEYIEKVERITIERKDGKPVTTAGNVAHAVKVTLKNGRVDYIAYSSDNTVEYEIVDGNTKFDFCGVVGVCQMKDGVVAYNYVNHGTKMANVNAANAEYTGKVVDFNKDYTEFKQWIDIDFDNATIDEKKVIGNHIYIENDGAINAVYKIFGIDDNGDGTMRINLENTALMRNADTTKEPYEITWNIAKDQYFHIPLTNTVDEAPVFEAVSNGAAFVDGRFETDIIATSPAGRPITYKAPDNLPASATFDEQTGKLIWAPTSYDLGVNHLAFTATDGILESTVHFNVTVYRAFTPGGSGDGGNGGGGGGGGGGSSSDDKEDPKPEDPKPEDPTPGADEGKKFIDLGSHNWAEEAIYALVEAGIVNGTSANTYSPAKNMSRADYAIMLTRAFGIEGLEGANFADVDENAYYAEELRLAKAAGIVGGIGDNKFNPTGEITRQDMMVMLVRAMEKTGMELKEAEVSVLAQFTDAADISDYAQEAVAKLVANGIIAGSDGKINPTKKTTRAEVAVMLARIFTK